MLATRDTSPPSQLRPAGIGRSIIRQGWQMAYHPRGMQNNRLICEDGAVPTSRIVCRTGKTFAGGEKSSGGEQGLLCPSAAALVIGKTGGFLPVLWNALSKCDRGTNVIPSEGVGHRPRHTSERRTQGALRERLALELRQRPLGLFGIIGAADQRAAIGRGRCWTGPLLDGAAIGRASGSGATGQAGDYRHSSI